MSNTCCSNCTKRDYKACKECKKENKFKLTITADRLNSLLGKTDNFENLGGLAYGL